jgi:hypothetical protein
LTLDWFVTSYPNENLGVGDTLVFNFGPPHNVYQFANLGHNFALSPSALLHSFPCAFPSLLLQRRPLEQLLVEKKKHSSLCFMTTLSCIFFFSIQFSGIASCALLLCTDAFNACNFDQATFLGDTTLSITFDSAGTIYFGTQSQIERQRAGPKQKAVCLTLKRVHFNDLFLCFFLSRGSRYSGCEFGTHCSAGGQKVAVVVA